MGEKLAIGEALETIIESDLMFGHGQQNQRGRDQRLGDRGAVVDRLHRRRDAQWDGDGVPHGAFDFNPPRRSHDIRGGGE